MNKVKEVKTNPKWPLVCENSDCYYKRECANHRSAGDFRTEDGIKPKLSFRMGELYCETIHISPVDDPNWCELPSVKHEIGFCHNPVEEIDSFEI